MRCAHCTAICLPTSTEPATSKLAMTAPGLFITPGDQTINGDVGQPITPTSQLQAEKMLGEQPIYAIADCAGLPRGLLLDTGTGVVTGTPEAIGDTICNIMLTNGNAAGARSTLTISIVQGTPQPNPSQRVIVTANVPSGELEAEKYYRFGVQLQKVREGEGEGGDKPRCHPRRGL